MRNINESKNRMKMLKSALDTFEKTEKMAKYRSYLLMSETDRANLWAEWDEYYKKVRESKIGRIMAKQKELFYKKEFGKVKEIAKWTNDNIDDIFSDRPQKPMFDDPYETLHNVSKYKSFKSEYESLRKYFEMLGDSGDDLI